MIFNSNESTTKNCLFVKILDIKTNLQQIITKNTKMFSKTRYLFFLSLICYFLNTISAENVDVKLNNACVKAHNTFEINLMKILNEKQKNVIISPLGIHMSLSILLSGSAGETYKQLWNVLG